MDNNGGYSPFMFGQNCYPSSMNNPQQSFHPQNSMNNVYAGQASRRDAYNVRDCMYWPASLSTADASRQSNAQFNGGMNQEYGMPASSPGYNGGDQYFAQGVNMAHANVNPDYVFHTGVTGDYSTGEPQMVQNPQQVPPKAFIQNGKGQIPIPCNMSPQPGVVPAVKPMQVMGYKVQVPQIPPTTPIEFEVSSAK